MKKQNREKSAGERRKGKTEIRTNTHIQSPFLNADLAFGGLLDS